MKAGEIQVCPGCKEHPTRSRNVFFYCVEVDQAILDARAVQQTMGSAMVVGGHWGLGEIFSPDPEVAKRLGDHDRAAVTRIHVCFDCYMSKPIGELVENQVRMDEEKERGDDDGDDEATVCSTDGGGRGSSRGPGGGSTAGS